MNRRNPKSPPPRRLAVVRLRQCPKCETYTRCLTQHLAQEHGVPLVMIGQGDFRREWNPRRS